MSAGNSGEGVPFPVAPGDQDALGFIHAVNSVRERDGGRLLVPVERQDMVGSTAVSAAGVVTGPEVGPAATPQYVVTYESNISQMASGTRAEQFAGALRSIIRWLRQNW